MFEDQHPLARLRALTGDTQESYARLVSTTHGALGFGHLGCRREKVSRWETQDVPPDYHTQLTIAHIHGIPERQVLQQTWPQWLHQGEAALPRAERGRSGGARAATAYVDKAGASRLTAAGEALPSYLHRVLEELEVSPVARSRDRMIGSEMADLAEGRVRSLDRMLVAANPVAVQRVDCSEFELTSVLLREYGYDQGTALRLHLVASRLAHECGWMSRVLGEDGRAERYLLAATNAAARSGVRELTAACLANLAWLHLEIGDPRDALLLADAARSAASDLPPQVHLIILAREARAHGKLGNIIAAYRALNSMAELGVPSPYDDLTHYYNIDTDWIRLATARAWLDAGQARQASEQFLAVLGAGSAGPVRQPPLLVARDLMAMVDAQLLLGEVEEAALTTDRAVALFAVVPEYLLTAWRRKFAHWRTTTVVQELMSRLRTVPAYRSGRCPR